MKIALHLVFLTIGCAMWTNGRLYAAADEAKHERNENKPAQQSGHGPAADKKPTRGPASLPKANHPQQPATNHSHAVTLSPATGSLNGLPVRVMSDAGRRVRKPVPPVNRWPSTTARAASIRGQHLKYALPTRNDRTKPCFNAASTSSCGLLLPCGKAG